MLFNGNERDSDTVRSTSYVMQENVHIGCFTVLQTLQFAADLRMPENSTPYEKTKRINQILKMLSMEEIANSLVGGVRLRGISGGQMKRLSIGVEIINLPSLIFLDEVSANHLILTPLYIMAYLFCAIRFYANTLYVL